MCGGRGGYHMVEIGRGNSESEMQQHRYGFTVTLADAKNGKIRGTSGERAEPAGFNWGGPGGWGCAMMDCFESRGASRILKKLVRGRSSMWGPEKMTFFHIP